MKLHSIKFSHSRATQFRYLFFGAQLCCCLLLSIPALNAQQRKLDAFGPVPNADQLRWQQLEYYAFLHFSINTFTDQEWGGGGDDPSLFNPTELDCRQWARVCKEAGMKAVILTAKHHSGFCLWPSKYTAYSVKNSPWKNGKGDIVAEMAAACKEYGLKFGVYLSPWDRNRADYGQPSYIEYFRNQLTELLTNYGDIFEVWFDGANGGTGYYGGANEERKIDRTTYYDWANTYALIRKLQPHTIIWNEAGPDIRWIGNEEGVAGETNWSLLSYHQFVPGTADPRILNRGQEDGENWVPGEVNTSIRPGWFYHQYEDNRVKSLPKLMQTYYTSIGRNGTFLLNFPIDRRGLIHENDEAAALQLAQAVKEAFAVNLIDNASITANAVYDREPEYAAKNLQDHDPETYWAAAADKKTASIEISFEKPLRFNRFVVQEAIAMGQRVKAFELDALIGNRWKQIAAATTIGYKRILSFPSISTSKLRLRITDSKATPVLAELGVFNAPQILAPPEIRRNKNAELSLVPADKESLIFYTTDGSVPDTASKRYNQPFTVPDRILIRAIAYDPGSRKTSTVAEEHFDLARTKWTILNSDSAKAAQVLDGDPHTTWFRGADSLKPMDLLIDLGETQQITGFRYLPSQGWHFGFITDYEFWVSPDNENWKKISAGEFSNIRNNPSWQLIRFEPAAARYIRLRTVRNDNGDNASGYAEFDLLTQ